MHQVAPDLDQIEITPIISDNLHDNYESDFSLNISAQIKKQQKIWDGILPAPVREATEYGNAQFFVDIYGKDLRYITESKRWMKWNGKIWENIEDKNVLYLVEHIGNEWKDFFQGKQFIEASEDSNFKSSEYYSLLERTKKERFINNTYSKVCRHPALLMSINDFDNFHHLFVCNNGVLNLKTREMSPIFERDHYFTRMSHVNYKPMEMCNNRKFRDFLKQTFIDEEGNVDEQMIEAVQRYTGYCMSGDMKRQKFQVWEGIGANGKDVMTDCTSHILGDYFKIASANVLIKKYGATDINPELGDIARARCAIVSETGKGQTLDERLVKAITGGSQISYRLPYQLPIKTEPTVKLIMVTNHKPHLESTGYAIQRRIQLVPFNNVVKEKDMNENLFEELIEGDGGSYILSWMLEGCKKALGEGLTESKLMKSAKDEYLTEENVTTEFMKEMFIHILSDEQVDYINEKERENNPDFKGYQGILFDQVYEPYERWANETGKKKVLDRKQFGKIIKEASVKSRRTSQRVDGKPRSVSFFTNIMYDGQYRAYFDKDTEDDLNVERIEKYKENDPENIDDQTEESMQNMIF